MKNEEVSVPASLEIDLSKPWTGYVPIASVVTNPQQPRTWFDGELLEQLEGSVETGQELPVLVMPHTVTNLPHVKWMLVDGERRHRALMSKDAKKIWIIYRPGITLENIHTHSFRANWSRVGHTHAESARAIDHERKLGKTYEQIGRMVGKTGAWASSTHQLLQLHPDLLAQMCPPTPKGSRISLTLALQLLRHPKNEQKKIWFNLSSLPKAEVNDAARIETAAAGCINGGGRSSHSVVNFDFVMARMSRAIGFLTTVKRIDDSVFKNWSEENTKKFNTSISEARRMLQLIGEKI